MASSGFTQVGFRFEHAPDEGCVSELGLTHGARVLEFVCFALIPAGVSETKEKLYCQ